MYHLAYIETRVEITELVCILNVAKFSVFVVNFPGYWIRFTPTVRRTRIESYLCGYTPTTIHEYLTVNHTSILLCAPKRMVFITFCTFSVNPSESRPNYFDSLFFQRPLFLLLLLELNTFNLVHPLCMYQQLHWLGSRVRVHIQFVWTCYVLRL